MAIKDLYKELGGIEVMLVDSYGEITPEIEEIMLNIKEDISKVVSWAIPKIKEHQGMVKIKKDYANEVLESAKYHDNKAEGLKRLIDSLMQASDLTNIETTEGKVSYRKSSPLVIDDEALIPAEYLTVKEVSFLDKMKIKKDLKTKEVCGVHLEEKHNIQIHG